MQNNYKVIIGESIEDLTEKVNEYLQENQNSIVSGGIYLYSPSHAMKMNFCQSVISLNKENKKTFLDKFIR